MKTALFFLFVTLFGLISAFSQKEYQDAFVLWMREQEKVYSSEEFQSRFEKFMWNMDYVEAWNSKNSSTVLGLNIFADLSNEEYQSIYLGTHIDATEALLHAQPYVEEPAEPLADTVNWKTSGAVTGIKNQGQCGSCWSFSTTGAVEGVHKIKKGSLVSLSEQNLMDCSASYGNQGCNGGLMTNSFKYIHANGGVDTESSYPYTGKVGTCHFSTANVGATVAGYKSVAAGSESALQTAVHAQPVAVAIDASRNSFQLYKSGIYYESACSSSKLDHGVLAVGYGDNGSNQYWVVKNSWGTSWGQAGYIQMSKNRSNNCGIATQASYPTV
jgi:cathepsin L